MVVKIKVPSHNSRLKHLLTLHPAQLYLQRSLMPVRRLKCTPVFAKRGKQANVKVRVTALLLAQ